MLRMRFGKVARAIGERNQFIFSISVIHYLKVQTFKVDSHGAIIRG